jgi:hypothetical protein
LKTNLIAASKKEFTAAAINGQVKYSAALTGYGRVSSRIPELKVTVSGTNEEFDK